MVNDGVLGDETPRGSVERRVEQMTMKYTSADLQTGSGAGGGGGGGGGGVSYIH